MALRLSWITCGCEATWTREHLTGERGPTTRPSTPGDAGQRRGPHPRTQRHWAGGCAGGGRRRRGSQDGQRKLVLADVKHALAEMVDKPLFVATSKQDTLAQQVSSAGINSPTHKRTEGRAPVWGLSLLQKPLHKNGIKWKPYPRLNGKFSDMRGGCVASSPSKVAMPP
jgi:hypothetical protein